MEDFVTYHCHDCGKIVEVKDVLEGDHIFVVCKECDGSNWIMHRAGPTGFFETKKTILDACCGGRQFWFNKEHPDVLFADNWVMEPTVVGSGKDARVRKCLPDKVMDFRDMNLENDQFQLVVFDPPHLFLGEKSYMAKSYGSLDKDSWKEDIKRGFSECFRVLKAGGILIFKWNECDVPLKSILKLAPYNPLFGHPSGKTQKTHWVCFMKNATDRRTEVE